MAGKRVGLASLAAERVEAVPGAARPTLVHVPPQDVAPTPLNPRVDFDKDMLVELGTSMKGGQLAPCVAITRARYVEIFPEHADELPPCTYVMAAGERRWRAALEVDLKTLDLHIRQDIAESPAKFLAAVLAENIERKNFNYIEEAFGLQRMLEMSGGSQTEAAQRLSKSKQWFSQRIGVLRLNPEMQQAVRDGKLTAFRDMRRYAAMPPGEQVAAWKADIRRAEDAAASPEPSVRLAALPAKAVPTPEPYTAVYTSDGSPAVKPALPQANGATPSEAPPSAPPVSVPEPRGLGEPQLNSATGDRRPVDGGAVTPNGFASDAEPTGQNAPQPGGQAGPRTLGTVLPWHDGAAMAAIVQQRMTADQQQVLLAQLRAALPSAPGETKAG